MSDDKQNVAETKPTALPVDAADSAREGDIDTILAQYDEAIKKPDSPPEPKPEVKPQEIPDWARPIIQRAEQENYDTAIKDIFGEDKISKRMAKAFIDQMVREKPAIVKAFNERSSNNQAWNATAKWLRGEWKKENPPPIDEVATADRDAVAAAVRGASAKATAEPPPNFGRMSDSELRRYTLENYGF